MSSDLPEVLREMSAELARMADKVENYREQLNKLAKPEIDRVVKAVCEVFHISEMELRSECRSNNICEARFAAYVLLREAHVPLSLSEIGKAFARDHSAVAHGIYRARNLIEIDPTYAGMILSAKQKYEQPHPTVTSQAS